MSKRLFPIAALLLAAQVCGAGVQPAGVLVVPNRYTLVQFGFDIARLRPVQLLSYELNAKTGVSKIFLWNRSKGAWDKIDAGAYSAGFDSNSVPLLVVRDPRGIPAVLESAPAWSSDMRQLDTPDIAALANMLNDRLRFTPQEWRWLAPRYGLKIRDLNEERRHYGRYGKPGQGPLPPVPEPGTDRPVLLPVPEADMAVEESAAVLDAGAKPAAAGAAVEEEPFEKGDAVPAPEPKVPEKKIEPAVSIENVPAVPPAPKAQAAVPAAKGPDSAVAATNAAAILDTGSARKPDAKPPAAEAPLPMDK